MRGAPLLAGDLIIVGNAGADFAGAVVTFPAYDLKSGELRWRFFYGAAQSRRGSARPTASGRGIEDLGPPGIGGMPAAAAPCGRDGLYPALKLVYIGTANGAPYNMHLGGRHGGDELYAASIIAIRADGSMAWYYQTTPGDRWDYDSTQKLVLADVELDGRLRQV